MPVTLMKYPVYVFASLAAVQEGVQSGLRIEADRQILSKQDVISAWIITTCLGIPGISWGGTVGGVFPKNERHRRLQPTGLWLGVTASMCRLCTSS